MHQSWLSLLCRDEYQTLILPVCFKQGYAGYPAGGSQFWLIKKTKLSDIRPVRLNIRQYWITGLIISISGVQPDIRPKQSFAVYWLIAKMRIRLKVLTFCVMQRWGSDLNLDFLCYVEMRIRFKSWLSVLCRDEDQIKILTFCVM